MPKKELLGIDIAGFIKERHMHSVRSMRAVPHLAIITTGENATTEKYLTIKKSYGEDIGAEVSVHHVDSSTVAQTITTLNEDASVHGIIIQLPLTEDIDTELVLQSVRNEKDVDGLVDDSPFDPATPTAILWLLASYNIDLRGKHVLVVGQGRLVGAPLTEMLRKSDVDVVTADESTPDLAGLCTDAQIIISACGVPNRINSDMVPLDAVVVDAGISTDNGKLVGDVADDVRGRSDVVITPKFGGVGPLTVAALYENLLQAVRNQAVE